MIDNSREYRQEQEQRAMATNRKRKDNGPEQRLVIIHIIDQPAQWPCIFFNLRSAEAGTSRCRVDDEQLAFTPVKIDM
jgi:hypothetical protein